MVWLSRIGSGQGKGGIKGLRPHCSCDAVGGAVAVVVFERAAQRDFCARLVFDFARESGHHVVGVFGLPDQWHADDGA